MLERKPSFDELVELSEYQPQGADLNIKGDSPDRPGIFLNGSDDGTNLLTERDICRLRLTKLFVEGQRVRIGNRTRRGRVTRRRDGHIRRDEERIWDEKGLSRSISMRHNNIDIFEGLEDGGFGSNELPEWPGQDDKDGLATFRVYQVLIAMTQI